MLLVTGGCSSVILLHYLCSFVHVLEHNVLYFLRSLNLVSTSTIRRKLYISLAILLDKRPPSRILKSKSQGKWGLVKGKAMTNSTIPTTAVTCPVRDLKLMTSHELSSFLASKWDLCSVLSIAIRQVSCTPPSNSPTVLTFVCFFQPFFPTFSLYLHQYKSHCYVFMHVYVIWSIFNTISRAGSGWTSWSC